MWERSVEKIDKNGNVLKTYNNMIEAAEDNFLSPSSIAYRCTGRMKNPFKNDGFTFRYKGGLSWRANEWSNKKPVEMIDRDGNVIKTYDSVHAASLDNNLSSTNIVYRCTDRVKNPFKTREYTFRYKEDTP